MHGAELVKAVLRRRPDALCFGFGGSKMAKAGMRLDADMSDYSVMGFYEVLVNLKKMISLKKSLIDLMKKELPDALVLIDYPDFNWRLAPAAKALGIKVFSYIPPSAWAWRKGRAKNVAQMADCIASIFPFELPVYEAAGANIHFVGNPLVDVARPTLSKKAARNMFSMEDNKRNILLLPGSRKQEISFLLPAMLETVKTLPSSNYAFHLLLAPGADKKAIKAKIDEQKVMVKLYEEDSYALMQACDASIATSGTVVLEAALLGLPSVVLYRMSAFTYFLARLFVHIDNFSLPNILAGRRVLPELLQGEVRPALIKDKLEMLFSREYQKSLPKDLQEIRQQLGRPGVADRTADLLLAMLCGGRKESNGKL